MFKIVLSISLLLTPLCFGAQTAEDYFHGGAQFYISNQTQKAKSEVFSGLKLYPNDQQLNGMAGLLKKAEEQQQQQQNQQQQQDQQKNDQKQQQQEQQKQSEQKKDSSQRDRKSVV